MLSFRHIAEQLSRTPADQLHLFHHPEDRLRLTVKDWLSFATVKPVWAAPLTHPGRHLALLTADGKPIVMLEDPSHLSMESQRAVYAELHRRYLTVKIDRILQAWEEFGAAYWTVETPRGQREFVTSNLSESVVWLSDRHLLLLDVDGNRYEIPDTDTLDRASWRQLHCVI